MAEWLSCKSITGVDVCLDLGFGLLMVEGPLGLVGPGIGVELVSQSPLRNSILSMLKSASTAGRPLSRRALLPILDSRVLSGVHGVQ